MPPRLSRPALFAALLVATLHPSMADTQAPVPTAKSAATPYARMVALWADVPAYHEILTSKAPGPRKNAVLLSSFMPTAPQVLAPGENVTVNIALVISATGNVEAARVLDSTDPRFNQAATDAVLHWLFQPALGENGPRISFMIAPVVFQGRAAAAPPSRHIGIGLAPLTHANVRYPRKLEGHFILSGDGGKFIRAARVVVTHAEDDTGQSLPFGPPGDFYRTSVGSISADDTIRNPPPQLTFSLGEPARTATRVRTLEGALEFVLPDLDPNATVKIENVAATFGSPIQSAPLRAEGVTIVLFDKKTADTFTDRNPSVPGGPADYDAGSLFGVRTKVPPIGFSSVLFNKRRMESGDLAVGIDDPKGRLVGFEFQTANGQPLHYDHNGWYHASADTGKRFDAYTLTLPPDAKMICWLLTEKSLQKSPFKFSDIPLPPAFTPVPAPSPANPPSTPAVPSADIPAD